MHVGPAPSSEQDSPSAHVVQSHDTINVFSKIDNPKLGSLTQNKHQ